MAQSSPESAVWGFPLPQHTASLLPTWREGLGLGSPVLAGAPIHPGRLHGTLHLPVGCCGAPLRTAASPLARGRGPLQTALFQAPFPKSYFPEGFRCLGVTHPCVCTFCSFLLRLPCFAGENEMVPVLLEGLTVPWRGAFGENIAVSPAAAVWRHKFLGTAEGLEF